jgi:xanthine dehydrogenase YagS FAD-binding subunit
MQPFALIRPKKLEHAQQLVRSEPDTRVFRAGGIDLLDRMKEGLDEPDAWVELRGVLTAGAGAGVAESQPLLPASDEGLHWPEAPRRGEIGALTTLAALAEAELPGADALMQAAGQAATPGIRNTATVGGNLLQRPRCWYFRNRELVCLKKGGDTCLALLGDNRYNAILGGGPSFIVHPSSLATALTALDATVQIHRQPKDGELPYELRELAKLFVTPKQDYKREHDLAPGDILSAVYIPLLDDMRSAYQAVREKQSHDWPLVEAAARMCIGQDGRMTNVRVALGHVAPIPWNAPAAAQMLDGQAPDAALFAKAAEAALADAKPLDGNAYKVPMSKGLLREVLHRASGLALPE